MPVQSRTGDTEQAYLRQAAALSERAQAHFGLPGDEECHPDTLMNYLESIAGGLRPATLRSYRSSVRLQFQRFSEAPLYAAALIRLDSLVLKGAKKGEVPARGPAQKRKSISQSDLFRLAEHVAQMNEGKVMNPFWPVRALRWLQASVITGLRPVEWKDAQWLGDPADGKLLVKNAKHTNGRSHGMNRIIEFDRGHWLAPAVDLHMGLLKEWMSHEGNTFESYYSGCRKALQRCVRNLWPKRDQHITLYSGRHQFSANLKADGATPKTVADLMGHNSEETAKSHYGKRRSGWGRLRPIPLASPAPRNHEPSV